MKKLILALGFAAGLLAILCCGIFGWPRYRLNQQTRGLSQTRRFLAAGDLANASVSARRVLYINPRCAEACRIMAELADLARSPAAVDWRQRVVDLEPAVTNKFKLAAASLRWQHPPYSLAAQTLGELEPLAEKSPTFQVLAAELDLKLNRLEAATAHFQAASRLEPLNELHRLNLAALRLQSTNQQSVTAARATLETLSTNSPVAPLALRWRVADNMRRKEFVLAESLARRLAADPRSSFEDRLQLLDILQQAGSPEFAPKLSAAQIDAATNAIALYSMAEWMGSHGLGNEGLAWLNGFDPKLREAQPIPLAMADLYLATTNWEKLEVLLNHQQWPDLEFLRLAFLAHASWEQHRDMTGDARWRMALRATEGRLGPLTLLLSLTTEWGRDGEDLLWRIAQRFPREEWVALELEQRYFASGNTSGLNRLYASIAESHSHQNDLTNKNNFASSSMLLKINLPKAHAIARELYGSRPKDPIIAATYAYSLHLQGRTREGLASLEKLTPESLESPPISLYYGVMLTEAGKLERAARYLGLAQRAPLLPEERDLLNGAKARCKQKLDPSY